MPFWIEGWVEVSAIIAPEEDRAWRGAINLGTLVDAADRVSERLFGLSKRHASAEFRAGSPAKGRGLPTDPSLEVRRAIEAVAAHERRFGAGEFSGLTHATWREVKPAIVGDPEVAESDWSLVFDLVRRLERDRRFTEDRIRFVIWYNW